MVGRQNNPLFRHNKLKMAVFGANVSHGCSMTFVDGTIKVDWSESAESLKLPNERGSTPLFQWRAGRGLAVKLTSTIDVLRRTRGRLDLPR